MKRFYIWDNMYAKLVAAGEESFDIDIRYLSKWVKKYPKIFPKCMLYGDYTPVFNAEKMRWEIWKGKHEIKFKFV